LVDAVFPAGSEWAGPLRTLAAAIAGDVFDAAELRETVRIGVTQPELPLDADYVRVMSLHKSKGLTARMVIVAGCVEGLIPTHVNGTGREQIAALEEQRRLFYVALTRATETLILSCARLIPWELVKRMGARVTKGDAENGVSVTSRFWNELGPQRPDVVAGTDLLED
jgi:superfamily I DNA/RNA helicase